MIHVRTSYRFVIAMAAVVMAACGDNDGGTKAQAGTSFVGPLAGSNLVVGLVVNRDRATAYVCDNDRVAEWARGERTGDRLDLTSEGGAHLTADVSDKAVTGTLTYEGRSQPFSLSKAEGEAGLYRFQGDFEGEDSLIGWIVLPSGEEVGTRRSRGRVTKAPSRRSLFARRVITPS